MRNLLYSLTPRRVFNASKILGSFYLSKWSGRNFHAGNPISLSIEPTTACNLGCPECISGLKQFTRPTGNLEFTSFKKTIDELHKDLIYLNLYFQGEPYINPDFLLFVKYAKSKSLYTSTSTNAHFLDDDTAKETVESGLDRLIISIDGSTQEVYEQYRKKGSLDKVLSGTKNLVKWKQKLNSNTPKIVFQYLVVKPNEHQLENIKSLASEIGIDKVVFKTAQVYDYKNGNPLIPENEKYSRYRLNTDGTYELKNKFSNQCWRMWHSSVVSWDGKMVPCCFDKDAQHQYGDTNRLSFKSQWRNGKASAFREKVLENRKQIEICKNCSEGSQVWA